jgi:hypothetical protein
MLKVGAKLMTFGRTFTSHHQFSVLFLDRKDILAPFVSLITGIKTEELKS